MSPQMLVNAKDLSIRKDDEPLFPPFRFRFIGGK